MSNSISNSNNTKTKFSVMMAAFASVLLAGMGMNSAAYATILQDGFPGISIDDIGQSAECVGVAIECRENSDNIKIKNNNNNNNGNNGGNGGNEQASLTVIKQVRCDLDPEDCPEALEIATPSAFTITIEANNPNPSQFSGSSSGTEVSLDAGHYVIEESNISQIETELRTALGNSDIVIFLQTSGDCNQNEAVLEGEISAGETQTCSITNVIVEDIL